MLSRYYVILLLTAPALFFLPKFFELRTVNETRQTQTPYNCSTDIFEASDNSDRFQSFSSAKLTTKMYTSITTSFASVNQSENICKQFFHLINNGTDGHIFKMDNNGSFVESSSENMTLSYPAGMLKWSYDTDAHMAQFIIIREHNRTRLDTTALRRNTFYYKIYILGLTTLLAQIIPMGMLLFFNIKICRALKTSRVIREEVLMDSQKTQEIS